LREVLSQSIEPAPKRRPRRSTPTQRTILSCTMKPPASRSPRYYKGC
jgi:hypothetical protein